MSKQEEDLQEWLKQVVTLDSVAIGLVVAFVDPAKHPKAGIIGALALLALAASVVAGVISHLLVIARGDRGYEGREAAGVLAVAVVLFVGFAAGFGLLAVFGMMNLA